MPGQAGEAGGGGQVALLVKGRFGCDILAFAFVFAYGSFSFVRSFVCLFVCLFEYHSLPSFP